jgi:hypothetical protein
MILGIDNRISYFCCPTTDPEQACIFIPVVDLLDELEMKHPALASKALEFASPHW